ncbi:pyruvate dehydrogenase E2 component (dihydrolipoamide acetyltransferase) [Geodermatophilus obscurus]|uniref:Acetyltransferase component of pyruvate dehydrogenase complex n=1 Tax=Geodermatophilus obscurus TaxID=1861 RepID=A0A1M7V0G2_9ACTN|nr:dihydrolipoyllysine-residue acetyltransferase [Geodermatophilus obscurus]SHN88665.1 pyruvate dehydrogenase E2 component (dihydrolipoamide acetyltransferase) [Geodermatophilus obscurus]
MTSPAEVTVPDIGDFSDIPVIEIHVSPGDAVAAEDPLITLESDKATMDVPSPAAGTVRELRVSLGDLVNVGTPILLLDQGGGAAPPEQLAAATVDQVEPPTEASTSAASTVEESARRSAEAATPPTAPGGAPVTATAAPPDFAGVHAGPSVRRLARELGVDLTGIAGSGPKGRVTKDDLLREVRGPAPSAPAPAAAASAGIPEIPPQDFSRFGPVEVQPLSRIQRLSGPHLHRSWLNVPHVTHDDDADITELDAYRKELDTEARAEGYRVTLLSFLLKASVSALREFPRFNSSLTPEKDALVYKRYFHIGVAVDTPDGLVVPVLRDVDRKGIRELSRELGDVSARARDGKLTAPDLQGGCFTISSLGGIGGTSFTPLVNAPEVAILGVVRSKTAPVWDGATFVPRLVLPLSLSYDHRVIDGALAARFTRYLCHVLEDVRRLVL